MSRKLVLYIAMSIDGYIATEDDGIDFLSKVESPGEDYGFTRFKNRIDTIIWGRRTYDKILSFGMEFPYKDKTCCVYSNSRKGRDENVEYFDSVQYIKELKAQNGKDIYCDGGAGLVTQLMQHQLIDEFILSIIPHFLGGGIRLFMDGRPEKGVRLISVKNYPKGLVQLHYK